jgi:flagellar export protein FliJ
MAQKPQYRLKTLLGLREKEKTRTERVLGECMAALKKEEDRLTEMEEELERMVARREAKRREYAEKQMRGDMSAQAMVAGNVYIERMKELEDVQQDAINGQKQVVTQREEEVEAARETLKVATQELKALEKHREKWEKQVKREQQLKEEDELDELAQTIFLSKNRK